MTAKPTYEELERRVQELEIIESEYKHLMEVSQENEGLFKRLYEKAPIGYQSLDENGHFLFVNPTWLDTLGYTKEEVIGKSFAEFLHPDWRGHFKEYFPRFKSIGEVLSVEFEMVKKNGDLILVSFTGKISRDKKGNFQQTHCIFHDITERKIIERELFFKENIIKSSSCAIATCDLEGNMTYGNPFFLKLWGFTGLEDFFGKPFRNFWMLSDHYEYIMRTLQSEGVWAGELKGIRKDGSLFDVHVSAATVLDDTGNPIALTSTSIDITDRKRSEEALRESEQKFMTLSNSGMALIWTSGADKLCNYFNDIWIKFTGRTAEQEMGTGWTEGVHPDDLQHCMDIYTGSFDRREKFSMEYRMRRYDGEYRWLVDEGCPRYDSKGEFLGYIGHCLDITQRKTAEEEVRRNESRLRSLVDILQSPFDNIKDLLDYALEQTIQLTGSKIGYIFNYNEDLKELVLNAWSKEVLPACTAVQPKTCYELAMTGLWGEAVRQRKPIIINDFQAAHPLKKRCPEGHVQLFKFVTIPIFKGEQIVSVVGLANKDTDYEQTDILQISLLMDSVWRVTETIRIEEENAKLAVQLQQSQKMEAIGQLAGGVAHDFNNMLGVILGYTEMALEKLREDDPLHKDLSEVLHAAERSADLTRQLLTFARKQTIAPKVIDLNDTVEGMLKMLRRLIGEDIDLTWLPGRNLYPVKMDPTQIDQILANLCVNARDAIEGVGNVTIETGLASFDEAWCAVHTGVVPGDFVLLAVSDDGCGMDQATISHLFEPFFTTKELGKGTGLGLASVYGAVTQNNGFINVYSEPGHGTIFKVYLPQHVLTTESLPIQVLVEAAARCHETILLVEDEPAILEMTTIMLKRLGYTVLAAGTPGEAIRLAEEHSGSIDLLMTDVVMPEMNGRDLAGKTISLYPGIKLLFMSGYPANIIARKGVLDDGVAFIQKPFSKAEMVMKLREALEG